MKRTLKRAFDFAAALFGLLFLWWLIALCWCVASVETRSNGMFQQTRIGRFGQPFKIFKIKTMHNPAFGARSSVTTSNMTEITRSGHLFRRFKLDEMPQLWNVLRGDMSIVGPRPDVPGFADRLKGADRIILKLRPGITGPAALAFRNEEELLSQQSNPEAYNMNVIWPQKVEIDRYYATTYGFWSDTKIILRTIKLMA